MQTITTTVDLEAEQAKRTDKARRGTWDITEVEPGHFRVGSQGNGQQTYEVCYDPAEEWRCTCQDFTFWGDKGLRCKHIEAVRLSSPPYPVMVLRNFSLAGTEGVKVRFSDEAEVFLSIRGRYPCSACGDRPCEHFRLAVPYFARWKWETAQRPDCSWGPTLLQSMGIIPPYIVRPDLVTKQSRWAPFGKGEEIAPGVRVWHTVKGKLFRFGDNGQQGHVYVGSDHPDGHTPCLICRDGCDHVERALTLAQEDPPSPGAGKEEETEAPKTERSIKEVTDTMDDKGFMDDEFRADQAYTGTPSYPLLQWVHGDPRLEAHKLLDDRRSEPSANVKARVEKARQRQQERFADTGLRNNADMGLVELRQYCQLDQAGKSLLRAAITQLSMSARVYNNVLKIARTVADLAGSEEIETAHVAEAIQYRPRGWAR